MMSEQMLQGRQKGDLNIHILLTPVIKSRDKREIQLCSR